MAVQTLVNTQNELIVSLVQKELAAKAKFAGLIEDMSRFATKGVKSVDIPRLDSFTAINRTIGASNSEAVLTDATDTILLNQNPNVKWIEDHASIYQSTIDFRMEAAERAGSALSRYLDNQIIAGLVGAASLSVNAATPADITKDDILDMIAHIEGENGNLDNVSLVVAVDQRIAMLKIDAFTRADIYGSSNIPNGQIGFVYGIPVISSNLVASQQALMFEKSGFAYSMGKDANLAEQPALDYGTEAKKVVVDAQFGTGGLQLGVGSAAAGKSPLVTKLYDGV